MLTFQFVFVKKLDIFSLVLNMANENLLDYSSFGKCVYRVM